MQYFNLFHFYIVNRYQQLNLVYTKNYLVLTLKCYFQLNHYCRVISKWSTTNTLNFHARNNIYLQYKCQGFLWYVTTNPKIKVHMHLLWSVCLNMYMVTNVKFCRSDSVYTCYGIKTISTRQYMLACNPGFQFLDIYLYIYTSI